MCFGPFEGSVVLLSRERKGERRMEGGREGGKKKEAKRRHGA